MLQIGKLRLGLLTHSGPGPDMIQALLSLPRTPSPASQVLATGPVGSGPGPRTLSHLSRAPGLSLRGMVEVEQEGGPPDSGDCRFSDFSL